MVGTDVNMVGTEGEKVRREKVRKGENRGRKKGDESSRGWVTW